jgi:hypothetical protein
MIIVQLTLPASAYRVGYVTVAAMRTVHIADHVKGAGRATTSVRLLPSETVIGSAKGPDHPAARGRCDHGWNPILSI